MSKPAATRRKDTPPASDAPHVRALTDAEVRVWGAWHASERERERIERERIRAGQDDADKAATLEAAAAMTLGQLLSILLPEPLLHNGRWALVREGKAKMSLLKAYKYASKQAEGTPYACSWGTMKRSYDKVQKDRRGGKKQVAPFHA
jgi:hypothetical protein